MKVWIFALKFLFIGALFIVSNNNLYLSNPEDFSVFTNLFVSWLSELFVHVDEISGFVINSEWLPDNLSSSQ